MQNSALYIIFYKGYSNSVMTHANKKVALRALFVYTIIQPRQQGLDISAYHGFLLLPDRLLKRRKWPMGGDGLFS